jgi:hypothetical protein
MSHTVEELDYKMIHGRWPKPILRPAKRLTIRRKPDPRAELPRHKRGEVKLTQAEIRRRLSALKVERGCSDCGFRAHPVALDFDHVRGVKSVNLSSARICYWSIAEHEIAKCDVVCANCHRIRTAKRSSHVP